MPSEEAWPCDYAVTQFNAGNARMQLAVGGLASVWSLLEARRCFEEARDGFMESRHAVLADLARRRLDLIADLLEQTTSEPR